MLTRETADPTRNIVLCFRGLGKLRPFLHWLKQEPNFPGVTALGVMLDADNDYAGRVASVTAQLQYANILAVGVASPVANIVMSNGRRIAVFVSPGVDQLGAIESIVINEIRQKQEWNCIDRLSNCVAEQSGDTPDPKSIAQIYVSLMSPRLCGVGRAFEAGVLDVFDPAYAPVRAIFQPLISRLPAA